MLAFVAAAVMAVSFIVWELRTPSPLMDLRLFRDRVFSTGVSSGFIHFIALIVGTVSDAVLPSDGPQVLGRVRLD